MTRRTPASGVSVREQRGARYYSPMRLTSYAQRVRNIWVHPGNQEGRSAALFRALAWRIQLTVKKEGRWLPLFHNLKFRAANDSMSRSIVYCSPWFEYDEMKFVARYLRP